MFDALRRLISDLSHPGGARAFDANDDRLAAAALLVHVAAIDGAISEREQDVLRERLKSTYGLDDPSVTALIEQAIAADQEAVDLYHFTSRLLHDLDEDARRRIVGVMWEVVFADGRVTEFEDNLIWRAADLLGISSRDRVTLRQQAQSQLAPGRANPMGDP